MSCSVCLPGDSLNLILSCCSPTPKVKWMKMGDKLPPRTTYLNSGKLLTLSAVDERDGGKYMCTATNSAGEDVHYFDVIVEGKPTVGDNCGFICAARLVFFFCFQAFDTVAVEVVFIWLGSS